MKDTTEKVYYSADTSVESVDMFAYRMMGNTVSRVYICHDNEAKCTYLKVVACTPDGDFKFACFPVLEGHVIDMSKPENADDEYADTLVREIGEANQSMFDIMRIVADEKYVTKEQAMDIIDKMIKEDDDDDNSDN